MVTIFHGFILAAILTMMLVAYDSDPPDSVNPPMSFTAYTDRIGRNASQLAARSQSQIMNVFWDLCELLRAEIVKSVAIVTAVIVAHYESGRGQFDQIYKSIVPDIKGAMERHGWDPITVMGTVFVIALCVACTSAVAVMAFLYTLALTLYSVSRLMDKIWTTIGWIFIVIRLIFEFIYNIFAFFYHIVEFFLKPLVSPIGRH